MAKQKAETMQWHIVLSLLFIWPLYCLSFLFGHCIVSPFYLAIALSLLFIWTMQWPNKKERQYNGQIKRRDNAMAK
jgi:hypothetical protein